MENKRLNLLGQVLATIGVVLNIFQPLISPLLGSNGKDWVDRISLALFISGFIISMQWIFGKLAQIDSSIGSKQKETEILRGMVNTYREAIKTQPHLVHLAAGANILSDFYLEKLKRDVENFQKLAQGQGDLELVDRSFVLSMLLILADLLPTGSLWIGITRLTSKEAWERSTANLEFWKYINRMKERSRNHELTVARLYCFDSRNDYESMKDLLEAEINAGLLVRYIIGPHKPRDISILWSPGSKKVRGISEIDLMGNLTSQMSQRGLKPICALTFETRNEEYLDSVQLFSSVSHGFDGISTEFTKYWSMGQSPNHASQPLESR